MQKTINPSNARLLQSTCFICWLISVLTIVSCASMVLPQPPKSRGSNTKVVLLGTGNPKPDPDRSGPATAIVVNGNAYLVDFGPGVVRRAAAASIDNGVRELEPTNLRMVFVTHLHSDHTAGYPDLLLTPWVMGRRFPLEVYGPKGIKAMTDHVLAAYSEDITIRTDGMERIAQGTCRVNAYEITPGVIYKNDDITVTAFPTKHGDWKESYGYRFDTADRSIVITGDTTPTQATIDACRGCDVLVHEALTEKFLANPMRPNPQGFDMKAYAEKYHTTTTQLAKLAGHAKPGLLILVHSPISLRPGRHPMASTPEDMIREIREGGYMGNVVVGRDLEIY
jgi:ribonuclease BN (tRNA processing enzyme)